jgi:hypothetical protein
MKSVFKMQENLLKACVIYANSNEITAGTGNVNCLKSVKRQMYDRDGFELLCRKIVLSYTGNLTPNMTKNHFLVLATLIFHRLKINTYISVTLNM